MNTEYSLEELKENCGENGKRLWVLIDGKIYDVTDFNHPGGVNVYKEKIGEDRADDFEKAHSPYSNAPNERTKYFIGVLKK